MGLAALDGFTYWYCPAGAAAQAPFGKKVLSLTERIVVHVLGT
jgi:hypothetical protein